MCVFQPHTYTRTKTLWNDFLKCFDGVDKLIVTDIYAAREPFDGVTKSCDLAEEISKTGIDTVYIEKFDDICDYLKKELKQGEIAFVMGAGDVINIGKKLVDEK